MANTSLESGRAALVAGASGLVGREILALLLADSRYGTVFSIGRRRLPLQHPKLTQLVVDLQAPGALPAVDDVFIALGTTLQVAGSQSAMRALDVDAVLAVAGAARAAGATRLAVVSSMGADAGSRVFYTRIKGEMEQGVARLGYPQTVVARPSQLAGDRASLNQPPRAAERLALAAMRWLRPLVPANYQPIAAADVAQALCQALATDAPGLRCLLSGAMQGQAPQNPSS